jgi:hypothetical protein
MKTLVNNKNESRAARSRLFLLAAATLLLAATVSAGDGKGNLGNPGVMPPQSHAFGKTYGDWLMESYKWMESAPVQINPMLDRTGEFAGVGQHGPVWFLGTDAWNERVERRLTIPASKAIFLLIDHTRWATTPADLDPNGVPWLTDEEILAGNKEFEDAATDLACEIDGKPIHKLARYRCVSPIFSLTFPDIAMEDIYFNYRNPLPPEALVQCCGWVSDPSTIDGYALLLAPLSVGRHTIHYSGYNAAWDNWYDVTCHITVKAESHPPHHGGDR